MTDPHAIAARYLECWNERDPARRAALLNALFAEDASYRDPLMAAEGRAGIGALIEGVQARFPEFRFAPAGRADGFGACLRFSWQLGPEGAAAAPIEGTDFAELDAGGRLRAVTGFLDRVPQPA